MNFAEAALVIQGSACVYSRKVEYLYALVQQTLELVVSKKYVCVWGEGVCRVRERGGGRGSEEREGGRERGRERERGGRKGGREEGREGGGGGLIEMRASITGNQSNYNHWNKSKT